MNIVLLQYKGKWYRDANCDANRRNFNFISVYFDMIVEVASNEFNVIKNRHGKTGPGACSDLQKMQFWVLGNNFLDLPTFARDKRTEMHLANFEIDEHGNLVDKPFNVPQESL